MTINTVKNIPVLAAARRATASTGVCPKNLTPPEQGVASNPEVTCVPAFHG